MNTKNKVTEAVASLGLREKVQNIRDKAREVLRSKMINDLLQEIFRLNRDIASYDKFAVDAEKEAVRAEFRLTKLDDADPDYEAKKIELGKDLERTKAYAAKEIERTKISREANEKSIASIEEKIGKIEAGEVKVSIDEMYALTQRMIETSL